MQGLAPELLKKLDLKTAISEEAVAIRNLVPAEPGWDLIDQQSGSLIRWLNATLRSGFTPTPQRVSRVRKTPGVRPVAHWGPVERILYRALAKVVLGDRFTVDRSPDKYVEFIKAPVNYSFELQREQNAGQSSNLRFFFGMSEIKYIVRSDIAAFYQYIDHAILGSELQVLGADYDAIVTLLELLAETQERAFGLPQLLDASDALSEVYIDMVERKLLREGTRTWRFNDDFLIACRDYSDALRSIELLDAAARTVGLVVNENKTLTYGFMTYMSQNLNLEVADDENSVLLDEVEALVGDYTDDFSDDTDSAQLLIKSSHAGGIDENGVDLQRVSPADVRLLRRALNALAEHNDATVIDDARRLFTYVPELTPSVLNYLRKLHSSAAARTETVLDQIIENTSLNDWQQLWLIDCLQALSLLDGSAPTINGRTNWVEEARRKSRSEVTKSIATLALARAGKRTFIDVMNDYEQCSAPTLLWLLSSIKAAESNDSTKDNQRSLRAVAATTPLHRAVIN